MLKSVGIEGRAYNANTEVRAGEGFSRGAVPAEILEGWVLRGIAEPIPEVRLEAATQLEPVTASVALPRGRRPKGR